jgi:hypothetical protein
MTTPISQYREERYGFGAIGLIPEPGIMWILIENGQPVAVDFLCPCGCGRSCYTTLGLNHPRKWVYSSGPNGPTLSPSIRWLSGCKSHFTITDGKVTMHEDSGK